MRNWKRGARRGLYLPLVERSIDLLALLGVGSLPSFIIVGAQKGGTTSLYRYLESHPQVIGARTKEPQFFSLRYGKGLRWYRACFPASARLRRRSQRLGRPAITGEATPYYLASPAAPGNIAETLPEIKLIALLRNPVDRCISHYNQMVQSGREHLPLAEAIAKEDERLSGEIKRMEAFPGFASKAHTTFSYLTRGRYIEQLESYGRYFRREQMLILKSESFFSDAQKEFNRVLAYLDLAPHELKEARPVNRGSYRRDENTEIRGQLAEYFRPYNERLYEYLGDDLGW